MAQAMNRTWDWARENAATLLLISTVVGGIWILRGSIVTTDDLEIATRNLATQADLAPLARRADVATDLQVVDTLDQTVASLERTVGNLDTTIGLIRENAERTHATVIALQETVADLGRSVEQTNSTVGALASTVATTRETVEHLSETVGRTDARIPLLVSCTIDLHFWNPELTSDEQPPLPESCEQARRQ